MVVHAWKVVPIVQARRDGQGHVHAQQMEGVVARFVVVLGDGGVEVLRVDLAAHGQQVQVAVHDVQGAHHAPKRGGCEGDLVRVLCDLARLGLAHVVQNGLVPCEVRQLAEPRGTQVDQVQHLLEVLLGPQIVPQAGQERRPLQKDVCDRVFQLPPGHVLDWLVHDRHALVHGVALRTPLPTGDQMLVPAGAGL